MSQTEQSDLTRRYQAWLAALMDAAQLFLNVYSPVKEWQPGVLLDALLALVDEDAAAQRRGDRVRSWRAQFLAVAWGAEAERREAKARVDLRHAVSVALQTARELAAVSDPLDPAHHELRWLLGWALTAVRNLAANISQLAAARARVRAHRSGVADVPAFSSRPLVIPPQSGRRPRVTITPLVDADLLQAAAVDDRQVGGPRRPTRGRPAGRAGARSGFRPAWTSSSAAGPPGTGSRSMHGPASTSGGSVGPPGTRSLSMDGPATAMDVPPVPASDVDRWVSSNRWKASIERDRLAGRADRHGPSHGGAGCAR